jgi:hypothetical protein
MRKSMVRARWRANRARALELARASRANEDDD